jgi:hypothetical protein
MSPTEHWHRHPRNRHPQQLTMLSFVRQNAPPSKTATKPKPATTTAAKPAAKKPAAKVSPMHLPLVPCPLQLISPPFAIVAVDRC